MEAIRNSFHRVLSECSESTVWKRFEIPSTKWSQNHLVMLCGSDSEFLPQSGAIQKFFRRVLSESRGDALWERFECSEGTLWKRFAILFTECSQNLLVMLWGSAHEFFPRLSECSESTLWKRFEILPMVAVRIFR